jgi:hypothetical protein
LALLASGVAAAQSKQRNVINRIAAVSSGTVYEVEIISSDPFLQSDLPVLRIGDQEITISRWSETGSPNTLIFILTPEQFRKAKTGDSVVFQYGRGERNNKTRDFGNLDKGKLKN